jgi:ParB family chromosome partitioning protein
MADNKRGLGRGLSALLGETADGAGPDRSGRQMAPIELIRRNPDQPRRVFNEEEIDALAQSIRQKGVLQPILVRPIAGAPGEFQIVAGERRWRAAQKAGERDVPVVIRDMDDAEALEIAILENVQRTDLNAVEEAQGYRNLIDQFGRTQEAVAEAVGKSRSHVANTMRLLTLPAAVQDMVMAGQITAGHARALVGADDPFALARQIVAGGLSVRETEALTRSPPPASGKPKRGKDIDTLQLEKRLADALGLKVDIRDRGGKGVISVSYNDLEQLEDICRRLAPKI